MTRGHNLCGSASAARSARARRRWSMRCASALRDRYDLAVVTNDIYTKEDAQFLVRSEALPPERIIGVETGGCPHTAIREDASINLDAVDGAVSARFPELDLVFVESGGDNLAATFSPELVGPVHLRHRRRRGRQDPAQGRPGHHALRPARDQQDRPRAPRRRVARRHGPRRQEDAGRAAVRLHLRPQKRRRRSRRGVRGAGRAAGDVRPKVAPTDRDRACRSDLLDAGSARLRSGSPTRLRGSRELTIAWSRAPTTAAA